MESTYKELTWKINEIYKVREDEIPNMQRTVDNFEESRMKALEFMISQFEKKFERRKKKQIMNAFKFSIELRKERKRKISSMI